LIIPGAQIHYGKLKIFSNPARKCEKYSMLTRHSIPQTSIGTGYDLLNSIFSPDGRNFQVEYAVKAVENGGTSIGIRCKDGVVLAVEKVIASKLLKQGANKRIAAVDRHVGVVRPSLASPHALLVYNKPHEADKLL
jgi:Proteasome subunit A N-terminal signature/Proteasome subunit